MLTQNRLTLLELMTAKCKHFTILATVIKVLITVFWNKLDFCILSYSCLILMIYYCTTVACYILTDQYLLIRHCTSVAWSSWLFDRGSVFLRFYTYINKPKLKSPQTLTGRTNNYETCAPYIESRAYDLLSRRLGSLLSGVVRSVNLLTYLLYDVRADGRRWMMSREKVSLLSHNSRRD